MTGWARIHRQLTESDFWLSEPFTKAQAWVDMIVMANHKEGTFWVRGIEVTIQRGQLGWSEVTMAKRWRWSRDKVRRFLNALETRQQIRQQKNQYLTTIVTICNYEKYQSETANDTAEKQQKNSKQYINKNDKNDKNNTSGVEDTKIVEEIRDFWNGEYGTKYTSVVGFQDNALFWLTQYSLKDIKLAIKNIRRSEYWRNEMTPLIFFRRKSPSKEPVDYIAQFMNIKASPVKKEQPQGVFAQIVQHERERGLL